MSQCTTVAPLLCDRFCMRVLIENSFECILSHQRPAGLAWAKIDLGCSKNRFKGAGENFSIGVCERSAAFNNRYRAHRPQLVFGRLTAGVHRPDRLRPRGELLRSPAQLF